MPTVAKMRTVALFLFALHATLGTAIAIPDGHRSCGCSRHGRRGVTVLEEAGPSKIVSEELIIPRPQPGELKGSKNEKTRELYTRATKEPTVVKEGQRLGLSTLQLQKLQTLDKSTRRRAATFLGFNKRVQKIFGEKDPPFTAKSIYFLEKELEAKAKIPRLRGVLERYDAIPLTPKDDKEPPSRRRSVDADLFDTNRLPKEPKARDLEKRQSADVQPRLSDEQVLKIESLDKATRAKAAKFLKFNPALYKLFVYNGPPFKPWVIRMLEKELNEKSKTESMRKALEKFDAIPKVIVMDKPQQRRSIADVQVSVGSIGQQHHRTAPSSTNAVDLEQTKAGQPHRCTEELDAKAVYEYKLAERMKEIKAEGWCVGLRGILRTLFDANRNLHNRIWLTAKDEWDCAWSLYKNNKAWGPQSEDISLANDGAQG